MSLAPFFPAISFILARWFCLFFPPIASILLSWSSSAKSVLQIASRSAKIKKFRWRAEFERFFNGIYSSVNQLELIIDSFIEGIDWIRWFCSFFAPKWFFEFFFWKSARINYRFIFNTEFADFARFSRQNLYFFTIPRTLLSPNTFFQPISFSHNWER